MKLRSKRFYQFAFLLCLVSALTVKFLRVELFGVDGYLDYFLGSSPSFLYLLGLIALVPLVIKDATVTKLRNWAIFISLGALAYEVEQYWFVGVFDPADALFSILALVAMFLVHCNFRKNITSE